MNPNTVESYCKCLSDKNEIWTLAFFLEGDKAGVVPGMGCVFSRADEIKEKYHDAMRLGAVEGKRGVSCHTTLCATNGLGRRKECIVGPRCLCVDLDEKVDRAIIRQSQETYQPDMVVESSPGKFHLYWRISPAIRLVEWSLYQAGLARMISSAADLELSAPTHLIRMPGFGRLCKDGTPFTPEIVFLRAWPDIMTRTSRGIEAKWPDIRRHGQAGLEELRERRSSAAKAALALRKGEKVSAGALRGVARAGRNVCLYAMVREYVFRERIDDVETAIGRAIDWNDTSFESPLEEREAVRVGESAFAHGYKAWRKVKKEMSVLLPNTARDLTDYKRNGKANKVTDKKKAKSRHNGTPKKAPGGGPTASQPSRGESISNRNACSAVGDAALQGTGNGGLKTDAVIIPVERASRKTKKVRYDINAAAADLIETIWDKTPRKSTTVLAAAIKAKQYDKLLEWFTRYWKEIGRMGVAAPIVFVKAENAWGEPVWRPRELIKDQFLNVVAVLISGILMKAYGSDDQELSKLVKSPPQYPRLGAAGEWLWKNWLCKDSDERQPPDVVVFQDGVYHLDSKRVSGSGTVGSGAAGGCGRFESDALAPKKYSNVLDCKWSAETFERAAQFIARDDVSGLLDLVPVFKKFMQDWFPDDVSTWKLVLRWFGYCMTTDYSRQKFMFMWGPSGSGKGSISRIYARLLGEGNTASMNYAAVVGRDGYKYQEASMHGKLLITLEETEGTLSDHGSGMARIKKIVGGERMTIERKYAHPFEDVICGKLVLQSNVAPVYQDKGGAIRMRMIALGFEHSYRENPTVLPPDECVLAAGEADALGTLTAMMWQAARRERTPFDVEKSRALQIGAEEVISQMDVIAACMEKYTVRGPKEKVTTQALIDLVQVYCDEHGVTAPTRLSWELKKTCERIKGVRSVKLLGKTRKERPRGWVGIGLSVEAIKRDFEDVLDQFSILNDEIGAKKLNRKLNQYVN